MTRKFERMVEKNKKQVNSLRKKQGRTPIGAREQGEVYKGRSFIVPALLIFVMLFFVFVYGATGERDTLYWITVIGYLFLSVYFYLRRPYLRIEKNQLVYRKSGRERFAQPDEIENIEIRQGAAVISFRGKKANWVLSKTVHLFQTDELAKGLSRFAQQHHIPFEKK